VSDLGAGLRGAVDLSSLVRRANAQAPGGASAGGAPSTAGGVVFAVDDATFGRVLELSRTVPVIVEFGDPRTPPSGADAVIREYGGRIALAVVDAMTSPQVVQAFQVQQVPMFAAVIGGRPLPLFAGVMPPEEFRDVVEQVLQVAGQAGVSGTIPEQGAEADAEPEPEPLPPLHQEAYDAIAAGDLPRAVKAYETALAQNPRDAEAAAGLAQVRLLERLQSVDAATIRAAAAERPDDVDAQLAVADLDVSGGHVEDAFARLLDAFAGADKPGREAIRTRLLEYFELVGVEDPRVLAARRRLTSLLY